MTLHIKRQEVLEQAKIALSLEAKRMK